MRDILWKHLEPSVNVSLDFNPVNCFAPYLVNHKGFPIVVDNFIYVY